MRPDEYELLDLDEGRKLERFGLVSAVRPAPAARGPRRNPDAWEQATVAFVTGPGSGRWRGVESIPDPWLVRCGDLEYLLRPTPAGQVGLFPEQIPLRERIARAVSAGGGSGPFRLLNLFGYTGGSTLAAARAGAEVTHVDSARGVVRWARRNAERNGLAAAPIRWIVEDAARFVAREARRGAKYDSLVLDPPSFGRGPKGETWKIEKDLAPLLRTCRDVVSEKPRFVLVTAHRRGWRAPDLAARVDAAFADLPGATEAGPLEIRTSAGAVLRSGTFAWRELHG